MAHNVLDYSGSYAYWSQTEAVTVILHRSDDGDVSVPNVKAKRVSAARIAESLGIDVAIGHHDEGWWIPHALLPSGREIQDGDEIRDGDGNEYLVRTGTVTLQRVGPSKSHFECIATRKV